MSQSLEGPWIKLKDEAFDGRAYYAGRTAYDGKRRVLFGWVPTKDQENDKTIIYGEVLWFLMKSIKKRIFHLG